MPKTRPKINAKLDSPVGEIRVIWTPDARRWERDREYREQVTDLLDAALPGRHPSPDEAAVVQDDDGQRALTALCGLDEDGDLYVEHGRRTRQRAFAPMPEGMSLP